MEEPGNARSNIISGFAWDMEALGVDGVMVFDSSWVHERQTASQTVGFD
jgi:hypothetical protein